jgi:YegS/Rv2252/BmrU family lipid kinase
MTDDEHASSDSTDPAPSTERDRVVVLNPTSGTAEHGDDVRRAADDRGYTVRETTHEGHAVTIAREAAAAGVDRLAVAGGDGTVNEVVQGLTEASPSGDVTLGVVPAGTENLFATAIGVTDVAHGFDLLEDGERRRIDVGVAGDHPFVVSCISGLPAEVSTAASSELKERFGSLAFVVAGLRELSDFSGLRIELTAMANGEETTWSGEALCALVGNVRRFVNRGGQADVEDGLFDVVVIERMPANDILTEATAQRLFGRDTEHVRHVQASQLDIRTLDESPITFSLDGEAHTHDALTLHTNPQSLTVCVGSNYEHTPTQ